MQEVIPNRLWLGNAGDARDISMVLARGIAAVVDLAMEEAPIHYPRDVVYCRFPLVDGGDNSRELIRAAVEVTVTFVESELPTLVTCGGGMSRSPAIAAAALAQVERQPLETALERVTQGAAHDVSTSLWAQIKELCETSDPRSRGRA